MASRPICSRSARSASAARPSTAVCPSVSPNRISIPAVIRPISFAEISPASCRRTAPTSVSSAAPYSARTARTVSSVRTPSNSPEVAPSRR